MDHKQHLNALIKTYRKRCGDSLRQKQVFWAYLAGWIPNKLAPEVFKENGLKFSGDERGLYSDSYSALRKDRRTKHLEDRELNEKLSRLTLEALVRKEEFKSQAALSGRITAFIEEVTGPHEEYRVMFGVNNLNVVPEEVLFWDCVIAGCEKGRLASWGFVSETCFPAGAGGFDGRAVILVNVKGASVAEAVGRARVKATRRLRLLRNYLKAVPISDEQLSFTLSKGYAVRNEATGSVGVGVDYETFLLEYDHTEILTGRVEEANEDFDRIKKFPPNMQELIERTLHWIGLSIAERDPDIKVPLLSTALETLLTTRADWRKGERIAYRGYLLGKEVGSDVYYMPQQVLAIYRKKSEIVHGSSGGVASVGDYWLMLVFAKTAVKNFIQFVEEHKLTKNTQVFARLLQSGHVNPLIEWLEGVFIDLGSGEIAESLREELTKPYIKIPSPPRQGT